jgi:hypothetical protein
MIKLYPSLFSNEKELQQFSQPYEIDFPIFFFEDEIKYSFSFSI